MIKSQDLPIYRQAVDGFKEVYTGRLREFDLKGDPQESKSVFGALKQHPADLVLAIGLLASRVAKENLQQTPIIFCMVLDPQRFSLSGENITGVTLEVPIAEVFSRIRGIFPDAKRIGVLYDQKKTGRMIDQAKKVTQTLGLSLISVEVESEKDLPAAARTLPGKIDLLWMVADSTVVTPESLDFLLLISFENNLPIIGFSDDLVRRGAVAGFSPDYHAVGEQAGRLALRVLRGEEPDQLPIRPAEKTKLSINLRTAQKMGIRFDPRVLQSVDKIYE